MLFGECRMQLLVNFETLQQKVTKYSEITKSLINHKKKNKKITLSFGVLLAQYVYTVLRQLS